MSGALPGRVEPVQKQGRRLVPKCSLGVGFDPSDGIVADAIAPHRVTRERLNPRPRHVDERPSDGLDE